MAVEFNPCVCQLLELMAALTGDVLAPKKQLIALIDLLIVQLNVLKALILLFMVDIMDFVKKIWYQARLQLIQEAIDRFEPPFGIVLGYTKLLSDCPPIATFAQQVKKFRDLILSDMYEERDELDQLIMAIEDKKNELESIDRMIDYLTEFRDALDMCGVA